MNTTLFITTVYFTAVILASIFSWRYSKYIDKEVKKDQKLNYEKEFLALEEEKMMLSALKYFELVNKS